MEWLGFCLFTGMIVVVTSSHDAEDKLEGKFCQFGVYHAYSKDGCLKKCQPSRGFIHPITKTLTCFNIASPAVPIFVIPNASSLNTCQCGVTLKSNNFLCRPEIIYGEDAIEECSKVCPEYTGYVFRKNKFTELIYCARSSEMEILELGLLVSRINRFNAKANKTRRVYECKCGVGLDGMQLAFPEKKDRLGSYPNIIRSLHEKAAEEEKAKKRKSGLESVSHDATTETFDVRSESYSLKGHLSLDELAATCSIGMFEVYTEQMCENACRKARGYFVKTKSGNQLICYQHTKVCKQIPSYVNTENSTVVANTTCECGVIFNEKRRELRNIQTCIPEVKYQMKMVKNKETKLHAYEQKQCIKTCQERTAFVFDIYWKRILVRCESNDLSTQVYEKLDWKGEVLIVNEETNEKKIRCECGLTSQSLSLNNAANYNLNTIPPSETFVSNTEDTIIVDERFATTSHNEIISSEINEDELYRGLPVLPPDVLSFLEILDNSREIPDGNFHNLAPIFQNEIENDSIRPPTRPTNTIRTNEGKREKYKKQDDKMRNNKFSLDELSYLLVNRSLTMDIDDLLEPQHQARDEFILPGEDYENPSVLENTLPQPRNTGEFVASCSLKRFETYRKVRCQNVCNNAKAFFLTTSDNNKELICYRATKKAKRIPSFMIGNTTVQADSICECGTSFNEKDKKSKYSLSCIPEIKYKMGCGNNGTKSLIEEIRKCKKICRDYVVYIFNFEQKPEVIRCELNTFSPKTYANLDWKIEIIKKEGKKGNSYYCECGLTLSSLNNADSHPENFASSSHYIVRNETNSTRRGQDNLDDVVDNIPYRALSNNTLRNRENAAPSNGDAICSQPVGNFYTPWPFYQPEIERFEFSTSTNANVELSDDRGMCSESVSHGEWTRRENEYFFRNQTTNSRDERNTDFADTTQPVGDLVVPSIAFYTTSQKEIGESSAFLLTDSNIPYEMTAENQIPECNTETGPDFSPAQKRMRNS